MLECIMLERLDHLKRGQSYCGPQSPEIDVEAVSFHARYMDLRPWLRELRKVLKGYADLPLSDEDLERNAL